MQPWLRGRIVPKLTLLSVIILLTLAAVAVANLWSSRYFTGEIHQLIRGDVTMLLDDARHTEQTLRVLSDCKTLVDTFFHLRPAQLVQQEEGIRTLLRDALRPTTTRGGQENLDAEDLRALLAEYLEEFHQIMATCRALIHLRDGLLAAASELRRDLDEMERMTTDMMIRHKADGLDFQLLPVEQLNAALAPYQTAQLKFLLSVERLAAQSLHESDDGHVREEADLLLKQLLSGLQLSLRNAGPAFAARRQDLENRAPAYLRLLERFHHARAGLRGQVGSLNDIQARIGEKLRARGERIRCAMPALQARVNDQARAMRLGTLALSGLGIVLTGFLILAYSSRILKPVTQLAEKIRGICRHFNLEERQDQSSADEIQHVLSSVERMAVELGQKAVSIEVLSDERQRFEDVATVCEDCIWELDERLHFRYASPMVKKILGYQPGEFLGKPFHAFLHPDLPQRTKDELQTALESRQPLRGIIKELRHKDGGRVYVEMAATPSFAADGTFTGYRGADRDITARRQAEIELEELNRQLQRASRAAGMHEVMSGILHNVGNIMNNINVSSSVLREHLHAPSFDYLSKTLNLLQEHQDTLPAFLTEHPEGKQLPHFLIKLDPLLHKEWKGLDEESERLCQKIQHVNSIIAMQQELGKTTLVTSRIRADKLFGEAVSLGSATLQSHQVRIEEDFAQSGELETDHHKVVQILLNLINNARQALDDNPPSQRQLRLSVEAVDDGRAYRFGVSDNGHGIDEEHLIRIFSYGFTTRTDGHGFGLHMSALLAKELGGTLEAQSDGAGKGAMFFLTLPVTPPDKNPASTA